MLPTLLSVVRLDELPIRCRAVEVIPFQDITVVTHEIGCCKQGIYKRRASTPYDKPALLSSLPSRCFVQLSTNISAKAD